MVYKYEVPKKFRTIFFNKKVVYCEVSQSETLRNDIVAYKVVMLNCHDISNIFLSKDLKPLNFIDKIKVKFKLY